MTFKYFSKNGKILPTEEAAIPLSNIEYQYGFGVYESIRVANKVPYFLKDHLGRLQESARIIDLKHPFSSLNIESSIRELVEKNGVETCNIKILLIGGHGESGANLYILCLNPLFPDKKLYKDGVHCITYEYERLFPHAKTLNMLGSYLGLRKAKQTDAYEALFIKDGYITEGTRTNFFAIKGNTIISPPESNILPGVTRKVLMKAVQGQFQILEQPISLAEVETYDALFLTSTSSKVLPIRSVDAHAFRISQSVREIMDLFDSFLKDSNGVLR